MPGLSGWCRLVPSYQRHRPASYFYGGWWSVWWTGTYSMVLTKAAFIHKKYLDMYTEKMPASIRAFTKAERCVYSIACSVSAFSHDVIPYLYRRNSKIHSEVQELRGHRYVLPCGQCYRRRPHLGKGYVCCVLQVQSLGFVVSTG